MDAIKITGIRAYGYTGALPEENVLGQWFEIDLILGLNIEKAAKSDDLNDTLDYREIINTVTKIVQTKKFALIEKLAMAIAEKVLTFKKIQKVELQLTKVSAPIPDFSGRVAIHLTRENVGT